MLMYSHCFLALQYTVKAKCSKVKLKKRKKVKSLSRVWFFVTFWVVAYQATLSMGFSRQKYWSGLPFPSPGDLPSPEIDPRSPELEADALTSEPPGRSASFFLQWFIFKENFLILGKKKSLNYMLNEI